MKILLTILVLSILCSPTFAEQLNIYSARKEALIKPLLDKFAEQHDVKVNVVTGKGDALLSRLKAEGKHSPADLLITTDVGRLYRAQQAGALQPVSSEYLTTRVAEEYRESGGHWYGLSLRSRAIVYAKDRVKPTQLSTYSDLADPKWKGKICIRSSSNVYNQSLVASFIEIQGLAKTEQWLKGVVKNFARPPQGGDRDQIKAVAAGQCDIAVVNNYYLGAMLQSKESAEKTAAEKVALFWPDQNGRGAHVNISGIGVVKSSKNTSTAIALMEFLLSDESQKWYADVNNEYPIVDNIELSETLNSWGSFKADKLSVEKVGQLNSEALMAMDRAGWK